LLTGVGFGLTAVAFSVPVLALTVVIWTFGEMIAAPVMNTYVADLAPAHLRGRYQGAYVMTFSVAFVLAPAIGTWLFAWSPTGLWLTCAALSVVSAALVVRSANAGGRS
jgi:MFS family permease